jgi:hypothetical protein
MSLTENADYQKGRYDELVEQHKEMVELFKHLLWQMQTSQLSSGSGVHGGQVNVYAGSKIEAKTVVWSISLASIVFSVLVYFLGLVALAFGVSIAVFSLSFGILLYVSKKKDDVENQQVPKLPKMP